MEPKDHISLEITNKNSAQVGKATIPPNLVQAMLELYDVAITAKQTETIDSPTDTVAWKWSDNP